MRGVFRVASVVSAVLAVGVGSASAASSLVRVGSAAPLPPQARTIGPLAAATPLHLAIALAPQNPAALGAFATAVSTPGSPGYGHFLTVPQFAAMFGATSTARDAVEAALRADGLSVGSVSANHLMIDATAPAATVERALNVQLSRVQLASGRVAFANTSAPELSASVAGYVQGIIGLDSVWRPVPQGLTRRPAGLPGARIAPRAVGSGPTPCSSASAVNQAGQGYTADQIAAMYGIGAYYPSDEGQGQTVALVEEQPYSTTDIATYQACYGTSTTVNPINVDGGPGAFTNEDGESALDIEQIIGLAPKATIDVYQGPNAVQNTSSPADILTAIVSQNQAKVISSSYGVCEKLTPPAVINSENTMLQEAAVQGQSFFISSGDSGSLDCYQATRGTNNTDVSLSVIDPGGQPFATAVGGTSLGTVQNNTWVLPDNGSYPSEFVWNDGGADPQGDQASASGGGVSDQWAMPSYQSGAAGSLNVISPESSKTCSNGFCREVPDVSADADPNSGYVVYSTTGGNPAGWGSTGGTSAAAPLWAAFIALANASPTCRGLNLGFVNPAVYSIASSSYLANFHDITAASPFTNQANNDPAYQYTNNQNPHHWYPLNTGYDMATGLGTPIANALGPALCSLRAPVYAVTVTSPGSVVTPVGKPASIAIHASDAGSGTTLTYSASGLPAGMSISSSSGVITGTPTIVGSGTVTVTATDQFNNAGSTQFTWTVVKPGPPTASGSLSGLKSGHPRLRVTFDAGANAAPIASVVISLPSGLSFGHKTKGIKVRAGSAKIGFTAKGHSRKLTIRLRTAETAVTITIAKPSIKESGSLRGKVRRHKKHKLTLHFTVLDAAGTSTPLVAKLHS